MSTLLKTESAPDYRLLSKGDIAKMLGYTTRTIDRLVAAKKIPFTTLPTGIGNGRKIKFIPREIDAWIRRNASSVAGKGSDQ